MVGGFGLSWQAAFGVITLLYFYSHYLFASGAAHIGAMYTAFLSVAIACGALWSFTGHGSVLGSSGIPDVSNWTRAQCTPRSSAWSACDELRWV